MNEKDVKNIEKSIKLVNEIARYFMEKSIDTGNNNFPDIVSSSLKLLNKLNIIYNEISSETHEYNNLTDNVPIGNEPCMEIDGYSVPIREGNFDIGDGYIIRDGRDFVGFRD